MKIQSPTSWSEPLQVGFHSLPARPQVLAQKTRRMSRENILSSICRTMNPFPTGQMSQRPRITNGTPPQTWSSWRMVTAPLCPGRPRVRERKPIPRTQAKKKALRHCPNVWKVRSRPFNTTSSWLPWLNTRTYISWIWKGLLTLTTTRHTLAVLGMCPGAIPLKETSLPLANTTRTWRPAKTRRQ